MICMLIFSFFYFCVGIEEATQFLNCVWLPPPKFSSHFSPGTQRNLTKEKYTSKHIVTIFSVENPILKGVKATCRRSAGGKS